MSKVAEQFWSQVSKDGLHLPGLLTPCWTWTGACDNQGYPRFKLDGATTYANRARLMIEGSALGPNDHVVTLCRNKLCVRPEHHAIGNEKDSRTLGPGGRIGPGDQLLARQMVENGKIDKKHLAECYGISLQVVEAMFMPVLPDLIDDDVRLLICGYNAGRESARAGHYFANPRHRIWRTLYEVGLTPRVLTSEEDQELLRYGIGLTDLMKNSIHGDGTEPTDYDQARLDSLASQYNPDILLFLGKRPAVGYFGHDPGWGLLNIKIAKSAVAVAPDPSPGNAHFNDLKNVWSDIATSIKSPAN